MCRLCNAGTDSVLHVFTTCPVALWLWERISFWCRVRNFYVFSVHDLLDIHSLGSRAEAERVALHVVVVTACWFL
ncbi:hypothetical protein HanIR_Chr10g0455091 [Helianthus annuus]|nr:hypothetical protein HanIR_Chr10g0455091 [Helianthus annuus]